MQALKLTQISNSVGVVLPKKVLARLSLEKGDTIFMRDSPNGVRLATTNPDFQEQMKLARGIMQTRRDVLAALARI